MKTLTQQLLFAVMFGALFGIPGAMFGRSYPPLQFGTTVFLFLMILVSQALPAIYNVFYESKDFESYLPLCLYGIRSRSWKEPFDCSGYIARITSNRDAIWNPRVFSGGFILFTIPIALLGVLLFSSIVYLLMFLLCFFLAKIPLFRKYQSVIAEYFSFRDFPWGRHWLSTDADRFDGKYCINRKNASFHSTSTRLL